MASIKSATALPPVTKTLIDQADTSNIYLGRAKSGIATSASDWQIAIIKTVGGTISILYANADPSYKYIWDNRASYSYS